MVTEIPDDNVHTRREDAIRRLAEFCLVLGAGSYGDAHWVHRQFVTSFGGIARLPSQDARYRLNFSDEGRPTSVVLEVELTSVGDARPILDAVYGRQADDWRRVDIERHLEVASGQRGSRSASPRMS